MGCYESYVGGKKHGNACDKPVCNSVSVKCVPCSCRVTGKAVNLINLLMSDGGRMLF